MQDEAEIYLCDTHQFYVGGMPVWVFALGFNGVHFQYDMRVVDIDEGGHILGLSRVFDLPIRSNREYTAKEASHSVEYIRETIEIYRKVAPGEAMRMHKGRERTRAALASETGSIPAEASTEPLV